MPAPKFTSEFDLEEYERIMDEISEEVSIPESMREYLYDQHIDLKDWRDYLEDFNESYFGWFSSVSEFAEQLGNSIGVLNEIGEEYECYFDWDKWGNDLLNGDCWESDGYYFRRM